MPDDTEQLNAAPHDAAPHDADQRPPQVGLECPSCGCRDLRVYRTRHRNSGITRERLCRHCGRKIVTRETLPGAR